MCITFPPLKLTVAEYPWTLSPLETIWPSFIFIVPVCADESKLIPYCEAIISPPFILNVPSTSYKVVKVDFIIPPFIFIVPFTLLL